MSNSKKYLWMLPTIFILGLASGGILQSKFNKNNSNQKNSKIEKTLNYIENKFIMNDSLNSKDSLSLKYFKQDCYIIMDLLNDSICTEQIYEQLKQRAKY
jgi:hypothetical protein